MTSVPNTLLINGNDIRSAFTGFRVTGDLTQALLAPGDRRGVDQVIPGADGEIPVPGLKLAAYNFSAFAIVAGANRGAKLANLRAAAVILHGTASDGLVTLHRRLANSTDDGFVECYANGRFNTGLAIATLNPITGQAELQFRNLSGCWRRVSDNVVEPV